MSTCRSRPAHELPEQTYTVTRADLVRYAGACGDFNPIHWSDRVADSVGLPGVIAHGMYTLALAARAVDTWAGGPGRVRRARLQVHQAGGGARRRRRRRGRGARHRQGRHRRRRADRARGHLRRREGARHAQGGAACLTGSSGWPTSRRCGSAGRPRELVRATHRGRAATTPYAPADDAGTPVLLLAGGSNLVVADDGLRRHRGAGRDPRRRRSSRTPAAAPWSPSRRGSAGTRSWPRGRRPRAGSASRRCPASPARVGATPIQNVGAYGQEVAETIASVRCWDRVDGGQRTFFAADCGFGYRTSRFKQDPEPLRRARR